MKKIIAMLAVLAALFSLPLVLYITFILYREYTEDRAIDTVFENLGCSVTRTGGDVFGSRTDINGVRVYVAFDKEVGSHFRSIPKCNYIYLDGCTIDMEALELALRLCPVDTMMIANGSVNDRQLSECKESLGEIQDLYLQHVDISDLSIPLLCEMRKLRSITIWDTKISDVGVDSLRQHGVKVRIAPFP